MYVSVCVHSGAFGSQKGALGFLKLEFQVVVSHLTWALRTQVSSSEQQVPSAPDHGAIALDPSEPFQMVRKSSSKHLGTEV